MFDWKMNEISHRYILLPGDSIYIQPFISYCFTNNENINAKLIVYEVAGAMNSLAQIELSYFNNSDRLSNETKKWFYIDPAKVVRIIVNESEGKKPEQYIIKDINFNFRDQINHIGHLNDINNYTNI